jgi:hypothetical protein
MLYSAENKLQINIDEHRFYWRCCAVFRHAPLQHELDEYVGYFAKVEHR